MLTPHTRLHTVYTRVCDGVRYHTSIYRFSTNTGSHDTHQILLPRIRYREISSNHAHLLCLSLLTSDSGITLIPVYRPAL